MQLSYHIYYDSLLTAAVLKNISKVWLRTEVREYVTSGLVFSCALLDVGRFWVRMFSRKPTIHYNLRMYIFCTTILRMQYLLPTRCTMFLLLLISVPICFDYSCRPSSGSLQVCVQLICQFM